MAERKLPQNLEAEMNVLGCAFLTTYALEKVCEELSSDMFLSEANKRIFEAIYELHQNKIPLDSATVKNEIEKKESAKNQVIMGNVYKKLTSLIGNTPLLELTKIEKEENLKAKALNQKRAKLFQMEDEYNDKVDTMTSRLQSSMENSVSSKIMFRIKWEIK